MINFITRLSNGFGHILPGIAACFVASSFLMGQATASDLHLVCSGSGSVAATQTSYANTYDSKTKRYNYGTVNTSVRRPFSGSAEVNISDTGARIKLPGDMIPALSSDHDGWFPINDIIKDERRISGTVKINLLNKPELLIDRMTGQLTLKGGLEDFTGACQSFDAGAKPKF